MNTWLPIKSEYLLENFENLLQYLNEADYEAGDKFLHETIVKLEEVAIEILENKFSHILGVPNTLDNEWFKNFKVVLTSIYASFKIEHDVREMIVKLLDSLVINRIIEDELSFVKIKDLLINLANGLRFTKLPYSLKDIISEDFNPRLFVPKLLMFNFDEGQRKAMSFETKGQCVFKGSEVEIITIPSSLQKNAKLRTVCNVGLNVELISDEKKRLDNLSFIEEVSYLNSILKSLSQNKPDSKPILKKYGNEDVFFVEVVDADDRSGRVRCKTIDPAYEQLELELDIPYYYQLNPYIGIQKAAIIDHLKPGNKLKVNIVEKEGKSFFSYSDQLNEYYYDIDELDSVESTAVYTKDYAMGASWLTDIGKIVNIKHEEYDEEIHTAESLDSGKAIHVLCKYVINDRRGNKIINAERVGEIINDIDFQTFVNNANKNILEDIIEYWDYQCPEYVHEENVPSIPVYYVSTLSHILAVRGDDMSLSHSERYLTAIAAKALSIIVDSEKDLDYCEDSLSFLRALWAFAKDPDNKWLKYYQNYEPSIDEKGRINPKESVLQILSTYKSNDNLKLKELGNSIDVDRIRHLVEASNTLIGNVSNAEIHRIKRTIGQCLGIESICQENTSDKYWFGEENEMLEFKTSVVFPPVKKGGAAPIPNPNVQIWNILKTVNGFLNSLHGGTLLIGVNDYGNANGIEADIDWLYKNHQILIDTADRYIQYIKLRIDYAFEAFRRKDSAKEITTNRVRYSYFQTDGSSILRIDILPYELGCVKIKSELELPNSITIKRPDFIKGAYLRNAVATEELTGKLREKIEVEKRSIIKDTEKQTYISVQEALETNKKIKLVGYQSASGVADRVIVPIDLLPQRGLVVGYEKDNADLRVFKLSRCSSVEILKDTFRPAKYSYTVDPFNMIAVKNKKTFTVVIKLNRRASLLIKERFPYVDNYLKEEKDLDYPYTLRCEISDVRGIGSYLMSILGNYKIIQGEEIHNYIKDQLLNHLRKTAAIN